MITSTYIHIPFCRRKCHYCSFVSYPEPEYINEYVKVLISQIKRDYDGEKLRTLYLGGGTPSLLSVRQIEEILSSFNYSEDCEITIEINPENISFEYLKNLRNSGINRLSSGAQCFDDNILKSIGRRHTVSDIFRLTENAVNAGFENISSDLIYGLPGQSEKGFEETLKIMSELPIKHISSYGLKIEEGSAFYTERPKELPDEDIQANMYMYMINYLTGFGYKIYEISNFSKPGFESKHNLNYWNNGFYYGFGCSASGYDGNIRYKNESDLLKFMKNPDKKSEEIKLTEENKLEEEIFLALRTSRGININNINLKYGINFEKRYEKVIEKYQEYLKVCSGYCKLTPEGFLLSNYIMSDFI